MKRNRFSLALVPAVSSALLAFGCSRPREAPPTSVAGDASRVCVDAQGRRVPDDQCRDDRRSPTFYHWYHSSRGGAFVPIGGFVSSRSFSRGASHPSSITRGGFGSSAHGHGAGA